jgi:hypothetical protein
MQNSKGIENANPKAKVLEKLLLFYAEMVLGF